MVRVLQSTTLLCPLPFASLRDEHLWMHQARDRQEQRRTLVVILVHNSTSIIFPSDGSIYDCPRKTVLSRLEPSVALDTNPSLTPTYKPIKIAST
ncbi:hypothetical protein F4677DRAFT_431719 [Hypoxylon crocopeplum]|nr:hypothetical protein F4677DRAFT_431719 [Hypoxylon crocopeplum]